MYHSQFSKSDSASFSPSKSSTITLLMLAVACLPNAGCQSENESHDHHHLVYYHKPEDFPQAVARLAEIQQALVSDQPFPAPREFEAIDHDHDHDHGHAEVEIIRVPLIQELDDIVNWLPSIAAESVLPKEPWDRINLQAARLKQLRKTITATDDTEFKKQFTARQSDWNEIIDELKKLVVEYDEWSSKLIY